MPLSLSETQAIANIADHLYHFLPGQPHPFADQRISFAGIAQELGLAQFWPSGSKLPAITTLLEKTLDNRRELFCPLILEIVRRGIKYHGSKGITREDIKRLNELLLKVKFKIPELWDESFLETLPAREREKVTTKDHEGGGVSPERLKELQETFLNLERLPPQERGFTFERFLTELFGAFGLNPRGPFRLQGEQIDGSLDFEDHTYLIEAKWRNKPLGEAELLIFRGKVEKATWSRGIFISVGGFTEDGLIAFSRGRPTNLIAVNGQDLYFVLEGQMRLDEVIRSKARRAAETGEVMVPVQQLILEGKMRK